MDIVSKKSWLMRRLPALFTSIRVDAPQKFLTRDFFVFELFDFHLIQVSGVGKVSEKNDLSPSQQVTDLQNQ